MKKILLQLYKEAAVDARIKDCRNHFLQSKFHKFMAKRFDLTLIGE